MNHIAQWTVHLFVFEHEDSVNVRADLTTPAATLHGHGRAQLIPGDPNVLEIGDGIAAGRALADLADQLLSASHSDLESLRNHARLERERHTDFAPADQGSASP